MHDLRTNTRLSFMVLALIALISCQSADTRPTAQEIVAEGARQVVGQELVALHADKTHYGSFPRTGNPWTEYHHPDGRAIYRESGRPETGTWSRSDDQVCYSYAWNADGPPYCYHYYVGDGRHYVVNANGDEIGVVTGYIDAVRPGDPEGLAQ